MAEEPTFPKNCRVCGRGAALDQVTCAHCGTALEQPETFAIQPTEAVATSPTCPGCGKPLAAEAVVCIECGFDRRKGDRLQGVRPGPPRPKRESRERSAGPSGGFIAK